MMYQLCYLKPKKKGFSNQSATFMKIDDAVFWVSVMKEKGCRDFKILIK